MDEEGMMTLDAALAVFFTVALFYFVLTTAFLVRTEVFLHKATSQAAQELGQYAYVMKAFKEGAENENLQEIMETAWSLLGGTATRQTQGAGASLPEVALKKKGSFLEGLDFLKGRATSPSGDQEEVQAGDAEDSTIDWYGFLEEPGHLLAALVQLKEDKALAKVLSAYFVSRYIPGKTWQQKSIFLKRMGVLGGLAGLKFTGSRLIKRGKDWLVQVQLSCRIRGLYYKYLKHYHFIRLSMTAQVW